MSGPVSEFDSLVAGSEFVFLVFYRGHWCPFCQTYLKTLHSLESEITAAHGVPIIGTAEIESHLPTVRTKTGYSGVAIVDPENLLAAELKKRGLLDVAITERAGYSHGMAQPGVLVMKRDGTVLYNWAIVPALSNLGGAKDRPSLTQIWDNVQAQMKGEKPVHKKYNTLRIGQVLWQQVFG